MKRKLAFSLLALAILWVPVVVMADVRAAIPKEPVVVEGTIQGLQQACMGVYCKVGEENLVAAMEDDYVLMGDDKYYFLPNLKPTLLARYINRPVKITGQMALKGQAILVDKAEVLEDGQWKAFYSEEIADEMKRRMVP